MRLTSLFQLTYKVTVVQQEFQHQIVQKQSKRLLILILILLSLDVQDIFSH
ncbi:hypothetical protein D3C72_2358290 [compost metagenome]